MTKKILFILIPLAALITTTIYKEKTTDFPSKITEKTISKETKGNSENKKLAHNTENIAAQEPMKSAKYILRGKVTKVSDGDTFNLLAELEENGEITKRNIRVRSYAIDTPESQQASGEAARNFLANQILHKEVNVYVINKDQYGRTVGVATINGKDINYETIKAGYAWHYKTYDKSKSFNKYAKAEKKARAKKIGLWKDPNPKEPWQWRKENREKNKNRR